jgi:hypothetical protein
VSVEVRWHLLHHHSHNLKKRRSLIIEQKTIRVTKVGINVREIIVAREKNTHVQTVVRAIIKAHKTWETITIIVHEKIIHV